MYNLITLLQESKIVKNLDIINFIDEEDIQVFYAKATLIDNSLLFVRESIIKDKSKYSYHWQIKTGELIIRWDNSAFHPKIETHPHHKHFGTQDRVAASYETTLETVLKTISKKIKK